MKRLIIIVLIFVGCSKETDLYVHPCDYLVRLTQISIDTWEEEIETLFLNEVSNGIDSEGRKFVVVCHVQ